MPLAHVMKLNQDQIYILEQHSSEHDNIKIYNSVNRNV